MGLFRPVDQFRWSAELDVVSVDSYPDPADAEAHLASAMAYDLTRSVGGGRPWLLMEQAPSAVNWRAVNVPKAPGQYRGLSLQAVARGSDAVLSFQWRAAATGAEKFHSGMLPHAGTDSRVWRDVVEPRRRPAPAGPGRGPPGARRGRAAARLGELVGAGAGLAPDQPPAPRRAARRVLPPAVRGRRDRRLRPSGERPVRLPAGGGARALPGERRRGGQRAPLRRGRRHGPDHLLLRHRRPARPGAARRLPGALVRPARPAGGGAGAAARRAWPSGSRARRGRAGAAGRLWQDVIDLRGAVPAAVLRRGPPRRRGGRDPARARPGRGASTSARCPTGRRSRRPGRAGLPARRASSCGPTCPAASRPSAAASTCS